MRRRANAALRLAAQKRKLGSARATGSERSGRPLVVGLFRSRSGVGEGARLMLRGLQAMGLEPAWQDAGALFPGHEDGAPPATAPSPADDGKGPVLLHLNPPEMMAALRHLPVEGLADRYRAAVWAWEQPLMPRAWRTLSPWTDEIWASSGFLAAVFEQSGAPVRRVPYPCALSYGPVERAAAPEDWRVLGCFSAASGTARKNPEGAADAFRAAFPPGGEAKLTLHAPDPVDPALRARLEAGGGVDVRSETLSADGFRRLFDAHDAFLSLHRSEGFGLSIARALAGGMPAVFTDHAAARDFSGAPLAFPVPYTPEAVGADSPPYRSGLGPWAGPDMQAAANALRRARALSAGELAEGREASRAWWAARYGAKAFAEAVSRTGFIQRVGAG